MDMRDSSYVMLLGTPLSGSNWVSLIARDKKDIVLFPLFLNVAPFLRPTHRRLTELTLASAPSAAAPD